MATQDSQLATWLTDLITLYQDDARRPDLEYSNLDSLERPTQIHAVTIPHGDGGLACVAVTHSEAQPNCIVRAFSAENLADLAEFSETADEEFTTTPLLLGEERIRDLFRPSKGLLELAALQLAGAMRQQTPLRLSENQFLVGSRSMIQPAGELPGALWNVTYRTPLPDPLDTLNALGVKRGPQTTRADSPAQPEDRQVTLPASSAFGAFSDPIIWFNEPAFPTAKEEILGRPWLPISKQQLVHQGDIAGVRTYAFSAGLFVVVTDRRELAITTLNQLFAAFSRSGPLLTSVSNAELVEVQGFDPGSNNFGYSGALVTNRNRLLGFTSAPRYEASLVIPDSVLSPLFEIANECALSRDKARQALRLLDAVTLLVQGRKTEAFVMGWTIIEKGLQHEFSQLWKQLDRSKSQIKEMQHNWTASQQIDSLFAANILDKETTVQLHQLRKVRNEIVHGLDEASESQGTECVTVASTMNPLPVLETRIEARQVIL